MEDGAGALKLGAILITGGSGTLRPTPSPAPSHRGGTVASRSTTAVSCARPDNAHTTPDTLYVLGDVRDYDHMAAAFAGHDLVIHAAASAHPRGANALVQCNITNVGSSANVVTRSNWRDQQ